MSVLPHSCPEGTETRGIIQYTVLVVFSHSCPEGTETRVIVEYRLVGQNLLFSCPEGTEARDIKTDWLLGYLKASTIGRQFGWDRRVIEGL